MMSVFLLERMRSLSLHTSIARAMKSKFACSNQRICGIATRIFMSRKNESITLSCTEADKKALEKLAIAHGCTWGDKANISELVQRIAQGKLQIVTSKEDFELSQLLDRPEVKRAIELIKKLDL